MNLLAILGVGATLYQIFKPKDPVDKITDHAILLTGQMVSQGVPVAEAAKSAVVQAVDQHFVQTGQLPAATAPTPVAFPSRTVSDIWRVTWTIVGRGKFWMQDKDSEAEANALASSLRTSGIYTNVSVVHTLA